MNTDLTPSNQRLLTLILILLSIHVLYDLYTLFVVEGRISFALMSLGSISWYLQLALSILIIVLLAKRKFGVLLFAIVGAGSEFIRMLFSLQHFEELKLKFWIFQLLNIACFILMILLLRRVNHWFFNLEFREKPIGFEKTFRLIRAFNLTFIIIQGLEYVAVVIMMMLYMRFQATAFLNAAFVLFLAMLVLTTLGAIRKTKIANLAFLLITFVLLNTFLGNSTLLLAPFTEDWNQGYAIFLIVYGLAQDILFLTFGILLFRIIRSYFKEKARLNNQSGSVSDTNSQLLDTF